jgi:hypothetical protein
MIRPTADFLLVLGRTVATGGTWACMASLWAALEAPRGLRDGVTEMGPLPAPIDLRRVAVPRRVPPERPPERPEPNPLPDRVVLPWGVVGTDFSGLGMGILTSVSDGDNMVMSLICVDS